MSQRMFTFDERIGLLFTVEGATLSICAVTIILCYALYKWARNLKVSEASDSILFLNLMLADLIQGIGTMPNVKWMTDGFITAGGVCTAQAAIKQVGIVGVAMTSLAIALYTFIVLTLRKDRSIPKHTAKVVVAAIWIFVALVIGIPNAHFRNQGYYGPSDNWCWIVSKYEAEQIVTEYLWVWIAALSLLLLYPIMFLLMRGWIGKRKLKGQAEDVELDTVGQPGIAEGTEVEKTKKVAQKMLYYPLIYIVCTLPNSIARWMLFKNHNPPSKFIFAANTLFALSGLFNFILFFFTRRSWVVGDTRQSGHLQHSRSQHGLAPPEHLESADPKRRYSATRPRDGVYSSPLFLSPQTQASHPLPPEKRLSSIPAHGEDYGSLAPGQ